MSAAPLSHGHEVARSEPGLGCRLNENDERSSSAISLIQVENPQPGYMHLARRKNPNERPGNLHKNPKISGWLIDSILPFVASER